MAVLGFGALALVALAPFGCSSDPATGTTGDGGTSDGSTAAYTLDNVCDQVLPKLCAQRKSCCQSQPGGFNEAQCLAFEKRDCEKNVAEVKAGTMTFDPTNIDACLAKLGPYVDRCRVPISEALLLFNELATLCKIFAGKVAEGGNCERSEQCATSGDQLANCTAGKCKLTKLQGAGATCSFGGPTEEFCKSGLFCDANVAKSPPSGTCKTATVPGQPCDAQNAFNFQCGLGYYCDKASAKCTAAKNEGATCENALECNSLDCDIPPGGATGSCTAVAPIAKDEECGQSPSDAGGGG